ncbi:MAG: VanZ family protein [Candidatus Gottesmanbacteria bacterium]|nr:VanZ family protein [Candidatus Gottesmanbacteria bacterium]
MKIVRLWGSVFVWMGVIFFFSTRQRIVVSNQDAVNFLFFKTLHVLEYALLYILTFRATKNPITSFFIVILYASSDEIHQLFVVTREGTVRDVIIDSLGACLAWISIKKLLPKSPKKLRAWVKTWLAI